MNWISTRIIYWSTGARTMIISSMKYFSNSWKFVTCHYSLVTRNYFSNSSLFTRHSSPSFSHSSLVTIFNLCLSVQIRVQQKLKSNPFRFTRHSFLDTCHYLLVTQPINQSTNQPINYICSITCPFDQSAISMWRIAFGKDFLNAFWGQNDAFKAPNDPFLKLF